MSSSSPPPIDEFELVKEWASNAIDDIYDTTIGDVFERIGMNKEGTDQALPEDWQPAIVDKDFNKAITEALLEYSVDDIDLIYDVLAFYIDTTWDDYQESPEENPTAEQARALYRRFTGFDRVNGANVLIRPS